MYTRHFGLTREPFSISPDPRCLYMSERHRDGLAHLLYGVHKPGGFVALTGEVGTGKTTLCRCLLEQLPPEVDVALILNPRVTVTEFLASVCEELRIPHKGELWSVKLLVDSLHRYLLEAHARGRRTVLIVDEAQQLPPSVLEQIRLLTNLETPTRKLLQIILIGQPELATLLTQRNLRQLNQRITARFHLTSLRQRETSTYIRHRLRVAGGDSALFAPSAIRTVYRLSGGIPRLVNILCDRALLAGYARGARRVTPAMVRRAARDVRGPRRPVWAAWMFSWRAALAAFAVAALSGAVLTASERVGQPGAIPTPGVSTAEARPGPVPARPEAADARRLDVAGSPMPAPMRQARSAKHEALGSILEALRLERRDDATRERGARPKAVERAAGSRGTFEEPATARDGGS
jgi:general secretion pathway protein A